jgi:hypothetical protein
VGEKSGKSKKKKGFDYQKFGLGIVIVLGILIISYILALCFPQPFFTHKLQKDNIILFSDKDLPQKETELLIQDVRSRISKSELFKQDKLYQVFICNETSRFSFFANTNAKVGGINYVYFNKNTFIRPADIKNNKLYSPSGNPVQGERTLSYFIAHEITHGMTVERIGRSAYYKLPEWIIEGYADYVGKGNINFPEELKKFKANHQDMDRQRSGLYLRYHLLVAYLLDEKKVSLGEILDDKFRQEDIEKELKDLKVTDKPVIPQQTK